MSFRNNNVEMLHIVEVTRDYLAIVTACARSIQLGTDSIYTLCRTIHILLAIISPKFQINDVMQNKLKMIHTDSLESHRYRTKSYT